MPLLNARLIIKQKLNLTVFFSSGMSKHTLIQTHMHVTTYREYPLCIHIHLNISMCSSKIANIFSVSIHKFHVGNEINMDMNSFDGIWYYSHFQSKTA